MKWMKEIIIAIAVFSITFGITTFSDNNKDKWIQVTEDHEKVIVMEKDIEYIIDTLDEISGQTGKIDGVTTQLTWVVNRLKEDVEDLENED